MQQTSRQYSNLSHSLLKNVTSSRGVALIVTKLLQVHWHGWFVHIIFRESPKWKLHTCHIRWPGCPQNVAAMTYPSSQQCLIRIPHHIPVLVEGASSYCQITLLTFSCATSKFQHTEVRMTRKGSLKEKRMVCKPSFCLQHRKYSSSDCLAHVRQLGADSMIFRWLDYSYSLSLISER
jgi:hypothetical protein